MNDKLGFTVSLFGFVGAMAAVPLMAPAPSASPTPDGPKAKARPNPDVLPTLVVAFDGAKHVLKGEVPNDATRTAIGKAAVAKYGPEGYDNRIKVNPELEEPKWLSVMPKLLPDPAILKPGVRMDGERVVMAGVVGSEAAKSKLAAQFAQRIAPLQLENKLRVETEVAEEPPTPKPADKPVAKASKGASLFAAGKPLRITSIEFRPLTAELTPAGEHALGQLARKMLAEDPTSTIAVGVHVDAAGDATKEQNLSTQRARAVAAFLVAQGMSESQLLAAGYGAAFPLGDPETAEGRLMNRRIEFKLVKRGQ